MLVHTPQTRSRYKHSVKGLMYGLAWYEFIVVYAIVVGESDTDFSCNAV